MATFKVGQRVRIVSSYACQEIVGRAATICGVASLPDHWYLDVDGLGRNALGRGAAVVYGEYGNRLAPLTDRGFDAFMESIRKLKPLHEEPKRDEFGKIEYDRCVGRR